MNYGALLLGHFLKNNYDIFMLDQPFFHHKIFLFFSSNIFVLKSILFNICEAILALFGYCLYGISFPIISLSIYLCFKI